jgi:carbon storage regulator CsrA
MLVLQRVKDERIIFTVRGVRFSVMVVDIVNGKVRLGCDAPEEVTIHREEVQKLVDAAEAKA